MGEGLDPEPVRPPDAVEVGGIVVEFEVEPNRKMRRMVEKLLSKRSLQKMITDVRTMYKRKSRKVNPVDTPLPDGIHPGGGLLRAEDEVSTGRSAKDCGGAEPEGSEFRKHAGKVVPRGSRLTPERLQQIQIGGDGFLTEAEKQLFTDILFEFEGALAFDDSEMGLLDASIEPPVVVHTVPHTPWQQNSHRLPKAMQEEAAEIIQEKLDHGLYEFSQGPYRGRYFLVEKKEPSKWRLVNDVQPMNKVTIRDAGLPPSVDEFSEDFAGFPILSSIDFYSGYYQLPLHKESRDLTAFMTPFGLVRMTRLPMGWTNSVAIFVRVIGKVLWQHIPHHARPFLDDVGIKGPKSRYDDEEVKGMPGVRKFVWEHAQIVRDILRDIWYSGMTISGKKCAFGMSRIDIVGMVCDSDGRHPEWKKVRKILGWPTPRSVKGARAFIGICVYYRIFIKGFAIIASPILGLFRKGAAFSWTAERQEAMDELKRRLTSAPILISLDFSEGAGRIVLSVDASKIGWGAILQQEQLSLDGVRKPARYESGIWNDAERKYDAVKLECRGLLKALKKLRFWLFGRSFLVETDAQTLVWLLNQPPNDLPNALLTRWLSYIRLFDFDVRHVKGENNGGPDGLSRRGSAAGEIEEEDDVDAFFDAKMYSAQVDEKASRVWMDEALYEEESDRKIGQYLRTMVRPDGLTDQQFRRFRLTALTFFLMDGLLFKRGRKGQPPRRVIGRRHERQRVIHELHDELGHRGEKATFHHVARRYQWRNMWNDCSVYVKTCEECQKRSRIRYEEPLHPTWSTMLWEKVGLDVVHMPPSGGYRYIVFARDDLSGWVEGRALTAATSTTVAKFLLEEVIARHGCPGKVVVDGGSENKGFVVELLERMKVKRVSIAAYHPQSNGLVERGHAPIVNSLSKHCGQHKNDWVKYLPLALWADRISVRRSTGFSAFRLLYGRDCILPIEFSSPTWGTVDWGSVRTRDDLIAARVKQLDQRTLDEALAAERLERSRLGNKRHFDKKKRLRDKVQELRVGDLALLCNSANETSHNVKLEDRWLGPYRVREVSEAGYYRLEELDGVELKEAIAGNRLKKFFERGD